MAPPIHGILNLTEVLFARLSKKFGSADEATLRKAARDIAKKAPRLAPGPGGKIRFSSTKLPRLTSLATKRVNELLGKAGSAATKVVPKAAAAKVAAKTPAVAAEPFGGGRLGPRSAYMSGVPRATTHKPLRRLAGPGKGAPVAGPKDPGVGPAMKTGQPRGWKPPSAGAEDIPGKTYLKGATSKGVKARVATKGQPIKSLVKRVKGSKESLKRLAEVPKGHSYGGAMKPVTAKQWISRAGLRGKTNLKWLESKIGKSGMIMLGVMLAHEATKKIVLEPMQLDTMLEMQEGQARSQGAVVKGTIRDEAAKALTGQMQGEAATAQQAAMQMMMQNPTLQIPQTGTAPRTGVPFRTPI